MPEHKVTHFKIPDTLETWAWHRRDNPHYLEVNAISSNWLKSFEAFSPQAQRAFNRCNFGLLASLAYPMVNKEHFRTCCDLMNMLFVFDEYTDAEDEQGVQRLADIVMDALRNPHVPRPTGESVVGEITRQFWQLGIKTASSSAQRHFIQACTSYTNSVVQEAIDRTHNRIRTVNDYFVVRRDTVGMYPAFTMLELDMELPDESLLHPAILQLTKLATDMIILCNDMCSYNVEQARGDGHNIVTTVMHHYALDLPGAMKWISDCHEGLVNDFMDIFHNLPNDLDAQLARYADGLGNWVRANDSWSFESHRYFGSSGLDTEA